jgi:hypothetical protein
VLDEVHSLWVNENPRTKGRGSHISAIKQMLFDFRSVFQANHEKIELGL